MQIVDLKFPLDEVDSLFPSDDEEGQNVKPSAAAIERACKELSAPKESILWHTPDVFSVRYGSSYVASARHGDKLIRFHSDEGTFKDGDDNAWF